MKSEYKSWFLNNILDKEFTQVYIPSKNYGRKYKFYNFSRKEVPFDNKFFMYLSEFVGMTNFDYDCYHIHKWDKGDYFDEHIDDRANRIFSYVCELKESECKTKLIVENTLTEDNWFDIYTKHYVPKIQQGQRISLTVFGRKKKQKPLL